MANSTAPVSSKIGLARTSSRIRSPSGRRISRSSATTLSPASARTIGRSVDRVQLVGIRDVDLVHLGQAHPLRSFGTAPRPNRCSRRRVGVVRFACGVHDEDAHRYAVHELAQASLAVAQLETRPGRALRCG